jgi:hypothetical protein
MIYKREDFSEVPLVPDQFYCPGCNASPDDALLPPLDNCPCNAYGTGKGSLDREGVEAYLENSHG